MSKSVALVSSLVLSLSVAHAADKPAAAPAPASKAKVAYGKPFSAEAAVPVKDLLASVDKYQGKNVKVTGLVTKVCQKKGCWFEVSPSAETRGVRITSADYTIFVPFDSAGRMATVEGTFNAKDLSQADADHLAKDGAKAGQSVAPAKAGKELQLAAVAVELQ